MEPNADGVSVQFAQPLTYNHPDAKARDHGKEETFSFEISSFDKALGDAGGRVEYADAFC